MDNNFNIKEIIESSLKQEESNYKENKKFTERCFNYNLSFLKHKLDFIIEQLKEYNIEIEYPDKPVYDLHVKIYSNKKCLIALTLYCSGTISNNKSLERIGIIYTINCYPDMNGAGGSVLRKQFNWKRFYELIAYKILKEIKN